MNWYKRRINRIYPSLIANAFVACVLFHTYWNVVDIATASRFWFVSCIMIYYIFIYYIGIYCPNRMKTCILIVAAFTAIWYLLIYTTGANLYGGHPIRQLLYFIFMLMGAIKAREEHKSEDGHAVQDVMKMLLFVILFYVIFGGSGKLQGALVLTQYFSLFALMGVVYFFHKVGNSSWVARIYNNRTCHFVIRFVGGLCLEIYIVQSFIFTDKYNNLFPLNLIGAFALIVLMAYLVRCLARLFSQTFKDEPYEWRKIVRWS